MEAIEVGTVERQREQLIEEIQTLPTELLQEVADKIAQLREKALGSETEPPAEQVSSSPYEAFKKSGFIGCGEGPSDLAANYKKYLAEGWKEKYGYR